MRVRLTECEKWHLKGLFLHKYMIYLEIPSKLKFSLVCPFKTGAFIVKYFVIVWGLWNIWCWTRRTGCWTWALKTTSIGGKHKNCSSIKQSITFLIFNISRIKGHNFPLSKIFQLQIILRDESKPLNYWSCII